MCQTSTQRTIKSDNTSHSKRHPKNWTKNKKKSPPLPRRKVQGHKICSVVKQIQAQYFFLDFYSIALYLSSTILCIILVIAGTFHSVRKLVRRYPLAVVFPALGLKLCDFYISQEIYLEILLLVLNARRPGTFFGLGSSKVQPAPLWFMVSTKCGRAHLLVCYEFTCQAKCLFTSACWRTINQSKDKSIHQICKWMHLLNASRSKLSDQQIN